MFATESVETAMTAAVSATAVQAETVQAEIAARMGAMEVQAGMTARAG
jgi:hypothetical protein